MASIYNLHGDAVGAGWRSEIRADLQARRVTILPLDLTG